MGQDPSGRGQLGRGRSGEVHWKPSNELAHPHERRSFGAGSVPEVENPSLSPCKSVAVSPRPRPLQGPTLRDWLDLSRPRTGSSDSKALRAALPSASKPRSVLGPAPQASLTEGDAWKHQADVQDAWDDPDITVAWGHRSRGGHPVSALRSQGWPPLCQAHDSQMDTKQHRPCFRSTCLCAISVSSILGALGIPGYFAHISRSQGLPAFASESSLWSRAQKP